MKSKHLKVVLAALFTSASSALPVHAGLIFTVEGPGVTQSSVPGVSTETFDDGDLVSAIGTYTGGTIMPADVWGGAGGSGAYLFATLTSASTLTFGTPQSYFGFWWSAGDVNNSLSLYSPTNALLGSYVIGDILPYLSSGYFGNPSGTFAGGNPSEAYAYLNFTATGTDYISRVVFGGSNFESDNHSITTERITPPGTTVPDSGSTLILGNIALLGAIALRRFCTKAAAK